jgi:predicted DNA binding CopG/RHH family protein
MSKVKLDAEEKEILRDFEAGEFKSVLTPQRKKQLAKAAEEAFKKDKRTPYQTLVSSILHKYVSGSLYDVTANKSLNSDPR